MDKKSKNVDVRLNYLFISIRFSYDELTTAIEEKYCQEQATVKHYIVLEVEYFEARLKVRYLSLKSKRLIMVFLYR